MHDQLGEQNSALFKVQHSIDTLPMGGCTITADGNRVLADAYKAAFGAPAATPGKADGSHASNKPATGTR
jgi:hypothetical protein